MQEKRGHRSNRERTEQTRTALLSAARNLFTERSYAETATPEIVAEAGVTRGALYHHFADKQALFRAVVEQESAWVAEEIERASPPGLATKDALAAGSRAFLDVMAQPGRTRLLLLDGPAVLGRTVMDEIDRQHTARTLRAGLAAGMRDGTLRKLPLDALTTLLSAAFDRAALAIAAGAPIQDHATAIAALLEGLYQAS
jgi:AcrR family transcriptional regulator